MEGDSMRLLIILLIIITLVLGYLITKPNNDKYNRYMCATQGYQADCKTPLLPQDRLK